MKEIKKLDGLSVAKLYATIMLFPAAIMIGIGILMVSLKGGELALDAESLSMMGAALAYPVIGFFGGLLGSFFYNLSAKLVGGIKVEFRRS